MITCLLLALKNWIILNVNIIFSRQSPVLPEFQPKFRTFVRIFILIIIYREQNYSIMIG
jgi:hypothetical protein